MGFKINRLTGLILGVLLLSSGCKDEQIVVQSPKPRPAKLITVHGSSMDRSLSFPAIVEADRSSDLTFQVSGKVTALSVLEGDTVKKGQVIARVEERDYSNSLAQAQAQYDNAETEYQRAKRLAEQDAISRSILETRKTNRDVAQAALDSAKKTSADTVLRAPFAGTISKVYIERYQNVQAKELIAVLQSDEVVAKINAPADIVAISPQLVPKNTTVLLDAAPGMALPATFKKASGQADPATQTYEISFNFDYPKKVVVLPGMTATVTTNFQFNNLSDFVPSGISIPVSAVVAEGDNIFVWKVNPSTMHISKAPIVIGMGISGDKVVVTKGIASGDVIVAAGGAFMHDDVEVRAWTAK